MSRARFEGILIGVCIAIFALMLIFITVNVWKGTVENAVAERTVELGNRDRFLVTKLATCEISLEQSKKTIPQEQAQSGSTPSAG